MSHAVINTPATICAATCAYGKVEYHQLSLIRFRQPSQQIAEQGKQDRATPLLDIWLLVSNAFVIHLHQITPRAFMAFNPARPADSRSGASTASCNSQPTNGIQLGASSSMVFVDYRTSLPNNNATVCG